MATPPNANPAQNAPPPGSTTLAGGGNTPAPSGPTRKVQVIASVPTLDTSGPIPENVYDISVVTTDRDGNGVSQNARVIVANHHLGTREIITSDGRFSEQIRVQAGQMDVVYQAVLNNGQTDSKPLSAPPAPKPKRSWLDRLLLG